MNGRRMVVVEDNADIVEIVCTVAEMSGIECRGVASLAGLLDALDRGTLPGLLLLDLTLPGVGTSELLHLLAARGCRARIVPMSGAGRPMLEQVCRSGEALGLRMGAPLRKPFRIPELVAVLEAELPANG